MPLPASSPQPRKPPRQRPGKQLEKPLQEPARRGKEKQQDARIEKKHTKTQAEKQASLTSPEGFVMLGTAIMFDLLGLIIFLLNFVFGIGLILSVFVDLAGMFLFGGWMYFRSGHVAISKKTGKPIRKTERKLLKRFGLAFLGEAIPLFGDIAFCWTIAVYFELKNN